MEQNNFDKYVMCLEQMTQEKKEVCEKTVQAIYDKWTGYFAGNGSGQHRLENIEELLEQTKIRIFDENGMPKTGEQLLEEMTDTWDEMTTMERTILGIVFAGTGIGDAKKFHLLMRNYKLFKQEEMLNGKCK